MKKEQVDEVIAFADLNPIFPADEGKVPPELEDKIP